jgi:hypothetical protein
MKLGKLVDHMKAEWEEIMNEKEERTVKARARVIASLAVTGINPPHKTERTWKPMTAAWSTDPQAADSGTHLSLSRAYNFIASLGKIAPFKKEISANIQISSSPEIRGVSYPGMRTTAVKVGYCVQYGNDVYFGNDGRIYLVDAYEPDENYHGKEYESEMILDSDWRTFYLHSCGT